MFNLLKRIFCLGWKAFQRQGSLTFATIFVIIIAIFLLTNLFLFRGIIKSLVLDLQEKADISVYFREDVSEEEILETKKQLSNFSEIKSIEYVSKEKALEKFVERHKDNEEYLDALEELGENPFWASLNIRAFESSQYKAIADFLDSGPFKNLIKEIDYSKKEEIINRLFSITSNINTISVLATIILIVLAVLVTFNTIKLTIFTLKEEIQVSRFVGASNFFIQAPFLVQGALCGILAALISFLIFSLGLNFFGPRFKALFLDFDILAYFHNNISVILLIQFIGGIVLGVFSSIIAVRKYLKV